ncbi:MAG: flagellar export chaperone FliS [Oscillospiraceae bacterium]|nr:flagellar export chaperone FliS [Oscillospiraceae bacterium]
MVAYSAAGNQYRQQSAMTASPGELTLMLYDGCIRNLKRSKLYIETKDFLKANDMLQKAQGIICELMRSLDMNYPISKQLMQLYDFLMDALVWANVKKDTDKIDEAVGLITELRDTWQQAVLIHRRQSAVATAIG